MRARLGPLTLALCWAGCGGAVAPDPVPDALAEQIEADMRRGGIPGLAAARIQGGNVTWIGTFGYADLEARRPVGEHTPFFAASISKTVVSVLLKQMVDRGELELDQPIDPILGFPVRHPSAPDEPITPDHLVTHTSGIVDDFIALGAATTSGGDPAVTATDFARSYVTEDHFGEIPGTKFDYSNAGFAFLGAVLERASGQTLPALSAERLFEPLGMTDSGWFLRDVDREQVAIPYGGTWEEGFVRGEHEGNDFYPATTLRVSIRDLSRFFRAVVQLGALDGARILDEASARALREPRIPELNPDQAFGFYYDRVSGRRLLGHTGSAVGASNVMFFDPELGDGAIVLTNSDAFVRARFGFGDGSEALYSIVGRVLAAE